MSHRRLIATATALAAGALAFWLVLPSARDKFTREVEEMIATANRGNHPALENRISLNLAAALEAELLSPRAALRVARNNDQPHGRQYRLVEVPAFHKNKCAAILFLRSGPGGDSTSAVRYSMNFTWEDNQWKADSLPVPAPPAEK